MSFIFKLKSLEFHDFHLVESSFYPFFISSNLPFFSSSVVFYLHSKISFLFVFVWLFILLSTFLITNVFLHFKLFIQLLIFYFGTGLPGFLLIYCFLHAS